MYTAGQPHDLRLEAVILGMSKYGNGSCTHPRSLLFWLTPLSFCLTDTMMEHSPRFLVYDHIQSRAPRLMHRRRHWDPVKDHGLIHPDLENYDESGTAQVNAVRGMVVAKGTCVVLLQGMSPYNSYSTLFITIA